MDLFSDKRQKEEMRELQRINCKFQAEEGFVMTGLHLKEEFKDYLNEEFRIPSIDEGIKDYVYVNENVYGVELDENYVILYRVMDINDLYTAYGKKVYFETDFNNMDDIENEWNEIKERMNEDLSNLRNWIYLQSTILGGLMMDVDGLEIGYFENLFKTFMTIATRKDFIPDVDTINNLLLDIRESLDDTYGAVVDNILSDLNKLREE